MLETLEGSHASLHDLYQAQKVLEGIRGQRLRATIMRMLHCSTAGQGGSELWSKERLEQEEVLQAWDVEWAREGEKLRKAEGLATRGIQEEMFRRQREREDLMERMRQQLHDKQRERQQQLQREHEERERERQLKRDEHERQRREQQRQQEREQLERERLEREQERERLERERLERERLERERLGREQERERQAELTRRQEAEAVRASNKGGRAGESSGPAGGV